MLMTVHDWYQGASLSFTVDDATLAITDIALTAPTRDASYMLGDAVTRLARAGRVTQTDVRSAALLATVEDTRRRDGTLKTVVHIPHEVHF